MSRLTEKRPTEALIELDALAFNLHSSKKYIGADVKYMAVVKADAYGHGAASCALRLESEGVDWFGVAIPEEGVELRHAGIKTPIMCLGGFWPGQEAMVVEHDLTPVVYELGAVAAFARLAAERHLTIDVHVKIDTGMRRVGLDHTKARAFAAELAREKRLRVTGLLTHFAAAEVPAENQFTFLQIERFEAACDAFRAAGHSPEVMDLANSPAAISHPSSRGNMVRLGGALYGLLDDILPSDAARPELKPVLSLRSRIAHLRDVPAGESLGYGRTFVTKRESVIALVPIGYADGYPRALSNRGKANVGGHVVPVVGRISMDWTLLDVTDATGVSVDDDVFLIGGETGPRVYASDLARESGTIAYEITCGIAPRVSRIYQ